MTGLSVEGSDAEWARALERVSAQTRAEFRVSSCLMIVDSIFANLRNSLRRKQFVTVTIHGRPGGNGE